MRLTIGVMGSSGGDLSEANLAKAHRLGEAIAARDAVLITGGCPGLPYAAVRGAKAKGGLVIGISPGLSFDEHRGKYHRAGSPAGQGAAAEADLAPGLNPASMMGRAGAVATHPDCPPSAEDELAHLARAQSSPRRP